MCPIARATAIVGDRWTIPIIRELFVGSARFDEIQAQTGSTAQMLASRLKRLEAEGMIERRVYSRRPLRHGCAGCDDICLRPRSPLRARGC